MYDLNALKEQGVIGQCPYCDYQMVKANVIGTEEYNVVRLRHRFGGVAAVFECPKCFEKSFCHEDNLISLEK